METLQKQLKLIKATPLDFAVSQLWEVIEIADRYDDFARVEKGTLQFIISQIKRLQAIETESDRYKRALRKIVCLNIQMPDEVFSIANQAIEGADTQ